MIYKLSSSTWNHQEVTSILSLHCRDGGGGWESGQHEMGNSNLTTASGPDASDQLTMSLPNQSHRSKEPSTQWFHQIVLHMTSAHIQSFQGVHGFSLFLLMQGYTLKPQLKRVLLMKPAKKLNSQITNLEKLFFFLLVGGRRRRRVEQNGKFEGAGIFMPGS